MLPPDRSVYVLRVWSERTPSGDVRWRASLSQPAGDAPTRFFSDPAALLAHLRALLEPWPDPRA